MSALAIAGFVLLVIVVAVILFAIVAPILPYLLGDGR